MTRPAPVPEGPRERIVEGVSVANEMPPSKILVVEDELDLLAMLKEWLEDDGHEVVTADGGRSGLEAFLQHRPALTITDLLMPYMDGFQLITRIREVSDAHVLALTALGGEAHLIRGLELGVDEYLVKPVSRRAFLARVQSLLRRARPPEDIASDYGDPLLSISFLAHEARVDGSPLQLRPTEFRLLSCLVQNRHRVVSHEELLETVWGNRLGSLDSLKWYVSSLRAKIKRLGGDSNVIVSVPRVGYRYVLPGPSSRRPPETPWPVAG